MGEMSKFWVYFSTGAKFRRYLMGADLPRANLAKGLYVQLPTYDMGYGYIVVWPRSG